MTELGSQPIDDVRGSPIYPATGPFPKGPAKVTTPAALAHPEERTAPGVQLQRIEEIALAAGRVVFGGYFVYNGLNHFLNRSMLVEYARSKGVRHPERAVAGSGLLILAGGLSIVTGTQPKIGAALITTFLAGVSPRMHAFWKETDPQQRTNELVNFTKNMALIGGSFLAAARPEPWPWRVSGQPRGELAVPRT